MHFGWPCSLVHGSGRVCLGLVEVGWGLPDAGAKRPSIRVSRLIPWASGGTAIIAWHLRRPSREMLTKLKVFLEPLGACRFRPSVRTQLKKAFYHSPAGGTYDKYQQATGLVWAQRRGRICSSPCSIKSTSSPLNQRRVLTTSQSRRQGIQPNTTTDPRT